MKNKIKGVVKQVCTEFVLKTSWVKVRKGKDLQCKNCFTPYSETEGDHIGLMTVEGQPNAHVCSKCAEYFKTQGAVDIDESRRVSKEKKETLIARISELNSRQKTEDKSIEELEIILANLEEAKQKELELLEKIKNEYVEVETEQYLIDDYSVVESKYLKHELEIGDYFRDAGYEFFKSGQGYYAKEVELLVKIGTKFFKVTLEAEIGSSKQDRGGRLYWVESIEKVSYEQVDKPLPKLKDHSLSVVDMNVNQYKLLIEFLDEHKISYRC